MYRGIINGIHEILSLEDIAEEMGDDTATVNGNWVH